MGTAARCGVCGIPSAAFTHVHRRSPSLPCCRDAVLEQLAQQLCYTSATTKTAVNIVAITKNVCVRVHVDTNDGMLQGVVTLQNET